MSGFFCCKRAISRTTHVHGLTGCGISTPVLVPVVDMLKFDGIPPPDLRSTVGNLGTSRTWSKRYYCVQDPAVPLPILEPVITDIHSSLVGSRLCSRGLTIARCHDIK